MDGTFVVNGVTRIEFPGSEVHSTAACAAPAKAFFTGPENRLAAAALERLLYGDGETLLAVEPWFKLLVISGASGTGKSHLARGLARHVVQQFGEQTVVYFSARDFARELRAAHSEKSLGAFRDRLASARLFVLEDLQALPQNTFVQRELRDALDVLQEGNRLVVVTALEQPACLTSLESGLRDRLVAGLGIRLSPPGVEARRELLRFAAKTHGISLDEHQCRDLAVRIDGPAPRLLQALSEVSLQSKTGCEPAATAHPTVRLKQIIAVVARYYSLTQAGLVSSARRKSLVHARGIVVCLARSLTDLSFAQIGRGLGGRDHSTVMHSMRITQRLAATDPLTQQTLDKLQYILTTA